MAWQSQYPRDNTIRNRELDSASGDPADVETAGDEPLLSGTSNEDLWPHPETDMEPESAPAEHDLAQARSVLAAVESNGELLRQLTEQMTGVCEGLQNQFHLANIPAQRVSDEANNAEIHGLRKTVADLEVQVAELEQQNSDLAAQVASSTIRENVTAGGAERETLSWAERKELILQQLEADSFDAEAFAAELGGQRQCSEAATRFDIESESPQQYVQRLCARLSQLEDDLAVRENEIRDLQHLLEVRPASCGEDLAAGAASIAERFDCDELLQQERQRLKELQLEWEEKFRQSEIEASLERAKLSRERQELAARQKEVDAELERLRRRVHQESEKERPRKWLSQLGLASS